MCGILGIVSHEPVDTNGFHHALDQLRHRGPDGQGTWFSPDRRTALGHTRLSIIDLETGSQPIANETNQLQLIANGEFYDHDRITAELKGLGHTFRTGSDSEIALHLFETYGHDFLTHLRGEFAFAIWDEANQTLFAARDRFGIKPFFYTHERQKFMFASEAKALFAAGHSARWDRRGMFQALHFAQEQDHTLYEGVRQLPPGHFLIARRGTLTIRPYWDAHNPAKAKAHRPSASASAETDRVRDLLETATHLRTRADVPLGCYLSGGVDSSAVLGLARRLTGRDIAAFSVSFDHPSYDESTPASEMAQHAGAAFHPVNVTSRDFASVFEQAVAQSENLHYNGHGPARYLLSRAVQAAGIKTVLGGEGADEAFAGYGFIRQSLTTGNRSALTKIRALLRFIQSPPSSPLTQLSPLAGRLANALNLSEDLLTDLNHSIPTYRNLLHPDFLTEHEACDPFRAFVRQFRRRHLIGREPFKIITYLWLKSHFANYVLAGERLDMAHAVEVRLPFLDHHLFDYTKNLPASLLYKDAQNKYLLRRAVANDVTPTVLAGAKKPFFAPPSARVPGNPMHELVQDLIRSERFQSVPFFDHRAIRHFLDHLPTTDNRMVDPILYLLASIAVLDRSYHCS